jgi:hypothetical protein
VSFVLNVLVLTASALLVDVSAVLTPIQSTFREKSRTEVPSAGATVVGATFGAAAKVDPASMFVHAAGPGTLCLRIATADGKYEGHAAYQVSGRPGWYRLHWPKTDHTAAFAGRSPGEVAVVAWSGYPCSSTAVAGDPLRIHPVALGGPVPSPRMLVLLNAGGDPAWFAPQAESKPSDHSRCGALDRPERSEFDRQCVVAVPAGKTVQFRVWTRPSRKPEPGTGVEVLLP